MIPRKCLRAGVDFSAKLQQWDGFGVNYVETAQVEDYASDPQDYGGFSLLSTEARREILELVFGDDGLRPGVAKMFIDPLQSTCVEHNGKRTVTYDHELTTRWMRTFIAEGYKRAKERSDSLSIIATLYGVPGWMTLQRRFRGRDLDPACRDECARYIVSFAKTMRQRFGLPIRYVSLHNEGEDAHRWSSQGLTDSAGHDYNTFWPAEQVSDMIVRVAELLREQMPEIGVATGETSTLPMIQAFGYADAILQNPGAIENLGLVTSHAFTSADPFWIADFRSSGFDRLSSAKPGLKLWVTSMGWKDMSPMFLHDHHHAIYSAKASAVIPWAIIQNHSQWRAGDPNPGTLILVHDDGTYSVTRAYNLYKHLCRAGRPGMRVCSTWCSTFAAFIFAFSRENTTHADTFVVVNKSGQSFTLDIAVEGTSNTIFDVVFTDKAHAWEHAAPATVVNGRIEHQVHPESVTTFSARQFAT